MHFQLRINLGDDAMASARDLGRALIDLGERLHDCDWIGTPHSVRDVNGNTVGTWDLIEEAAS
jgi:hypothetical protein